jgi:polar amino acid transport system substrate-binding protein
VRLALVALTGALVLAGCGTSTTATSRQVPVVDVIPKDAMVVHPTPPKRQTCDPTASLAPLGPLPSPGGQMPAGSWMARIKARGYLKVGVAQTTYLWGYRDPVTDELIGFDIDILHQVAQAIFGSPDAIEYTVVPNIDREHAVESGQVDIVAETMTMNCEREKKVDFSTEYYSANQKILVPQGSTINSSADLGGKRVCGPAGSTSIENLVRPGMPRHIQIWAVNDMTGCLVMLQQHQVDAISTDDAILVGLHAQDPTTRIVGPVINSEPYGLAISKAHPELTRFVNGVLAQVRADGAWMAIWDKWLQPYVGGSAPQPPAADYG